MKIKGNLKIQERLTEIEDRRIDILMQIPNFKDDFEKISELNHEYVQLGDEYYQLKLKMIKDKDIT